MSLLTDAQDAYLTNSGYDVEADASKAQLFLVAVRNLLMLAPTASADERTRLEMNTSLLQKQYDQCRDWLMAHGVMPDPMNAGVGETALDFSDYRGGWGGASGGACR